MVVGRMEGRGRRVRARSLLVFHLPLGKVIETGECGGGDRRRGWWWVRVCICNLLISPGCKCKHHGKYTRILAVTTRSNCNGHAVVSRLSCVHYNHMYLLVTCLPLQEL